VKFSIKVLLGVIIASGVLFALILAHPIVTNLAVGSIIIDGADGPTAIFQNTETVGAFIFRCGLLVVCIFAIVFSAFKLYRISKTVR